MRFFDWLRGKKRKDTEESSIPMVPPDDIELFNQFLAAMEAAKAGPKRPLLYAFQHVVLREAAFENHPELLREFERKESPLPLLYFRSKAYVRLAENGLVDPCEESEADGDAEAELFKPVAVHPHKRNGYTTHVVTMPTPESPPEAHFVAIVHKDDEPKEHGCAAPSTRYFTLESSNTRLPVLCEWREDGSHLNYGEGPAPEMAAFVEAVFKHVIAR